MTWIDTHAHLDDSRFDSDRPAMLARAAAAGVTHILTIGIDLATSRAAVALAEEWPQVWAVVGIQPNHVAEAAPDDLAAIEALATHPRVVAIGETGLDRYWDRAPFALQEQFFEQHLALARRVQKPVVIHCRQAEADVVARLEAEVAIHGPVRGVMHSFSGDQPTAERCLAAGLHISFAGMVTYKSAADLRTVAAQIPLHRILVETDSPYLAPVPKRGQRNEPAHVADTGTLLATERGVSAELFARTTTENARELFGLST